jgi:TRAP-type C4-dicarboxylate transport system permease small subunit
MSAIDPESSGTPQAGAGRGNRITHAVDRLSGAAGALAAWCVVLLMVLISIEVALRNFLGRSTMISDELSGYLYAAVTFFGMAMTLRDKGFIRVEALYDRFRGRGLLAVRWVLLLTAIAYVVVLLAEAVRQVLYLYRGNVRAETLSQTPLVLPQSLMVIGWALLLLQLISYAIKRVRDLP